MSLVVLGQSDPQKSSYRAGKDRYVPPDVESGTVCKCGRDLDAEFRRCAFCREDVHKLVKRDPKAGEISDELREKLAPDTSTLCALLA